jgi:hypothetical protein
MPRIMPIAIGQPGVREPSAGNNFGVLVLSETPTAVELQCSGCGGRHTVKRFRTESVSGRVRDEPEIGQWLPCPICQDWSPVEVPPDQSARFPVPD